MKTNIITLKIEAIYQKQSISVYETNPTTMSIS